MFKKAVQHGRSERGGVDPLHSQEQRVPQDGEPPSDARTKPAVFFNILLVFKHNNKKI